MKLDMVVRESVASYIVRLLCSRSSLPLAGLLSLVTVTEMCQSTTADERLFLKAPTAVVRDRFGWDVALDGNVAVSTTFADQNGQPGATYLMDALDGSLIHKVSASDGNSNDYFGFAAAIDGNTLVVGDPVDPFLAAKPGSIYIYNATTGVQQPKVFATDSTAGDEFGFDVSVSGNRILVGAPQRGNRPGAAYVVDASNPSSQVKLTPSGAFSGDDFGYSVAIDGNLAAVGSSVNYKIIGEMTGGSLYLFDATTGAELHRLKPSDTAVNDEFGWSVALDGELAIVGAPHQGVGKGVAYLFNTTTGAQLNRITAPVSVDGDDFGYAVDMQNGLAVIGAPAGDGVPSHVYVYDTASGEMVRELIPHVATTNREYGFAVSMDGGRVLVGAPTLNVDGKIAAGASYTFCVLLGDADCDGQLGLPDIDELVTEIVSGTHDSQFDMNNDMLVDKDDLDAWLMTAGERNLGAGQSYEYGDANLDGIVNDDDFALWNQGKFTSQSKWSQGDFSANGHIDVTDFNIFNERRAGGPLPTWQVPEPALGVAFWLLLGVMVRSQRHSSFQVRRADRLPSLKG